MGRTIVAAAAAVVLVAAALLAGLGPPSGAAAGEPDPFFPSDIVIAALEEYLDPAGQENPEFIIGIVEEAVPVILIEPGKE